MPRTLTIAALLPALGAATAAWAQPVPLQQAPDQTPYPAPSHTRQLSWPGRPAAHPASRTAPDWASAPADSFAPPQQVVADSQTYAARPPIIPHGGYPWRSAQAYGEPQQAPAPEFRPVTSHPDAVWRPYVSPPAETPAPDFTPPPPYQPSYQPPPWTRQPTQSQPQPSYQASPAPIARAPTPSQTPWSRAQPEPQPQPAPPPPVQHTPLPQPTPAPMPEPMPEPLRPMPTPQVQPIPRVVAPAPQPAPQPTPEPVRQPPQTVIAEPQPAPPPPPVQPAPQLPPEPQPQAQPEPAPAPAQPAVDPLAPRRDALIFQLQRNAPQAPAASPPASSQAPAPQPPQIAQQPSPQPASQPAPSDAPAQSSARYYSVHRQAGRQPDATPLPAPNYLDALPVELDQPIASDDLAQPPEAPAVMRDAQGRLRAAPLTDGPDLP